MQPSLRIGGASRTLRLFMAICLAVLAVELLWIVWLVRYGDRSVLLGYSAARSQGAVAVTRVASDGPAARVLEPGDVLLAVDGDPRAATIGVWFRMPEIARGTPYRLTVERKGVVRDVVLQARLKPRPLTDRAYWIFLVVSGLAFAITALFLSSQRWEDPLARHGAFACLLPSLTLAGSGVAAVLPFLSPGERIIEALTPYPHPFHLAVAFAFYRRFPAGVPTARWLEVFERALLGAFFAWWIVCSLWFQARTGAPPFGFALLDLFPVLDSLFQLNGLVMFLGFSAICGAIARSYSLVTEEDQKRRLRWITFGSLAGIGPWFLFTLAALLPGLRTSSALADLNRIANIALVIVPITTGYAILKHRLFDIRFVLRRGLQYLFARNVLRVALFLPIAGLVFTAYRSRHLALEEILFESRVSATLFALALLAFAFRGRLTGALDRRFFRAAYDREHLLLALSESVARVETFVDLASHVNDSLDAALHPKAVVVLTRDRARGSASLAFSSSEISRPQSAPPMSTLLRHLDGLTKPLDWPAVFEGSLPGDERQWLAEHGIALLVPLATASGALEGVLLLGEKRSEEPYATRDRELLAAIGRQMAIVLENAGLKERVVREERLARELLSRYESDRRFVRECPSCARCHDGDATVCDRCGARLVVSLPVERQLGGRYRLDRLLGRGGMGAVYASHDERLGRAVAVKVLMGPLLLGRDGIVRFEREARTSARLAHPNIITVFDYGALGEDGAYLVMELVRGVTLRTELAMQGTFSAQKARSIFEPLLAGLGAAHAAGVVHRDLKPENVLLGRDEKGELLLKILDFGLAKTTLIDAARPESLTVPGTVLGTMGYMSPEQIEGKAVDPRSDIFSVGIRLAEALTGRPPFRGTTLRELLYSTMTHEFRLPGEEPGILALNSVLARCLAKERDERYLNVEALKRELLPALDACPAIAGTRTASDVDVPTTRLSDEPGEPGPAPE
ncbi:MAG: protein kinase [Acidobacteria bacterium]|nr:protein kinase [Acidobacteriota bacterium]